MKINIYTLFLLKNVEIWPKKWTQKISTFFDFCCFWRVTHYVAVHICIKCSFLHLSDNNVNSRRPPAVHQLTVSKDLLTQTTTWSRGRANHGKFRVQSRPKLNSSAYVTVNFSHCIQSHSTTSCFTTVYITSLIIHNTIQQRARQQMLNMGLSISNTHNDSNPCGER